MTTIYTTNFPMWPTVSYQLSTTKVIALEFVKRKRLFWCVCSRECGGGRHQFCVKTKPKNIILLIEDKLHKQIFSGTNARILLEKNTSSLSIVNTFVKHCKYRWAFSWCCVFCSVQCVNSDFNLVCIFFSQKKESRDIVIPFVSSL